MREDFNKLLVERERLGHHKKFHEHRRMKAFDRVDGPGGEFAFGGRESMKKRHKYNYDMKSFNENLNPLKGFLRSKIGKKWDKVYSELRKTFDSRSVINNHILEHLFQYVDIHAKLIDGRVMTMAGQYSQRGYVPIKESFSDYYVCPKDGTLKVVNKQSYRTIQRQRKIEREREAQKTFRVVDADTHLRFIDGVWYVFGIKDLPPARIEYQRPGSIDKFRVNGWGDSAKYATWEELNAEQRKRFGLPRAVSGTVRDVFLENTIYQGRPLGYGDYGAKNPGTNRYYATKATASQKLLKKFDLVGTAEVKV